jgi:hypothetical protein
LTEGSNIISLDGETTKLSAFIKEDRYGQFFGANADVTRLSEVRIDMTMTKLKFNSLTLSFIEDGRKTVITIESHTPTEIAVPDWIS